MHLFKRRKLDQASSSLTRPFCSPLRTDADAKRRAPQSGTESKNSQKTFSNPVYSLEETHDTSCHLPSSPSLSKSRSYLAPNIDALQKEYAALSRQLTTLRQSLDVAQQALKFETDHCDAEVETLKATWKQVVRDAAEEIFESSGETFKMNFADREQRIVKDVPFWIEEQLNALTDKQREMLHVQHEEAKAQAEKYGLIEMVDLDSQTAKKSQVFTMELMLRQMHIDLDLVGFDRESQWWVD